MPKNIRKNMRKISEAAKASTTMPRKVLNPSSDKKENFDGVHDIYSTGKFRSLSNHALIVPEKMP